MTLYFATQAYLHDDDLSSILPVDGMAAVDPRPLPPCGPIAAVANPAPRAPTAMAVAFPLNPIPLPPSGKATLENPAPVAPQGKAVDQTPNPPPKAPGGGKAEDV
jgi:hypothetical protein